MTTSTFVFVLDAVALWTLVCLRTRARAHCNNPPRPLQSHLFFNHLSLLHITLHGTSCMRAAVLLLRQVRITFQWLQRTVTLTSLTLPRLYFTTFPHPAPSPEVLNRPSPGGREAPAVRCRSRGRGLASPEDDAQYYYFTIGASCFSQTHFSAHTASCVR
jgi:hypothetical protein